jgi:pyrimidine-nucleoside phosphorylase
MAINAIHDGSAWEKFRQLVIAQGGDVGMVDDPEKLPKAQIIEVVQAPRSGNLAQIHARIVGEASVLLGAGRARKSDPVDHAVGIIIHHKVGDHVEKGEPLFTLHANDQKRLAEVRQQVLEAHQFSDAPVEPLPLFYE